MKYIALDIGNVICFANMDAFIKNVSDTFNVSSEEAARWLRSFQQLHDLGLTTMERELRNYFGCKSETTIKRLITHWNDSVYVSPGVTGTLKDLTDNHNTKIALLSNIGVEHAELMPTKLMTIYQDAIKHFSCFVGARKPTMLYYQSFLLQYPEFKGCLYIDDLQENLNASKQFGFNTFRFSLEDPKDTYKLNEIRRIIIEGPEMP